jgi:hypothetical protein
MTDQTDSGISVDLRAIRRGAIIFGVGGMLACLGLALSGKELADATRRYVDHLDVPPTELARKRFLQAKQAATASALAGAEAWSKGA